ncbi:unnamed protein product [Colias eurytheme]|nr:unnamed protein product [Colias eurytheme]
MKTTEANTPARGKEKATLVEIDKVDISLQIVVNRNEKKSQMRTVKAVTSYSVTDDTKSRVTSATLIGVSIGCRDNGDRLVAS